MPEFGRSSRVDTPPFFYGAEATSAVDEIGASTIIAEGDALWARRVDGRLAPAGHADRTICLEWTMDQRPEAAALRLIR